MVVCRRGMVSGGVDTHDGYTHTSVRADDSFCDER